MPLSSSTEATKPPKLPSSTRSPYSNAPPDSHILTPLKATSLPSYSSANKTTPVKTVLSQCPPPPRADTIAASTSFFGIPFSLSSGNLRPTMGLDAPPPGEIDWVSIFVVYWITLVSEASRGLMLPSTWPYFSDLGGSKATLGVFVASFSMGRMATTIPLGYLSDSHPTSTVLIYASLIQVFGHLIYALAPNLAVLFFSRIVVGFGSATMSVCRAHLTRAVPSSLRTHHFAYLSALQFIGFAVLPGAGGLLALLPAYDPSSWVKFNGFTYPAYVLVISNVISIILIYILYLNPLEPSYRRRQAGNSSEEPVERGPDVFALIVCLLVNVVFRGVVAEFETVSTPFLMEQFGMTYGGASFCISIIGFFGLFVYLGFKPIAKRFTDRTLVFFGLVIVLLGCLPLSVPVLADHMTTQVYVFCLGLTWSLAYPIGQTAILSLFSKVLAGLPAGGFLGIFSATGSLARVGFAMFAGIVWSHFGRGSVFATILAYVIMSAVMVIVTFRRLVPSDSLFY